MKMGGAKLVSSLNRQHLRHSFKQFTAQCQAAPAPSDEVLQQRYFYRKQQQELHLKQIVTNQRLGVEDHSLIHRHKTICLCLRNMKVFTTQAVETASGFSTHLTTTTPGSRRGQPSLVGRIVDEVGLSRIADEVGLSRQIEKAEASVKSVHWFSAKSVLYHPRSQDFFTIIVCISWLSLGFITTQEIDRFRPWAVHEPDEWCFQVQPWEIVDALCSMILCFELLLIGLVHGVRRGTKDSLLYKTQVHGTFITCSNMAFILMQFGCVEHKGFYITFQLIRSLRPIRLLNKIPALRSINHSIFLCMEKASSLAIVILLCMVAYAVCGLALFSGNFWHCRLMPQTHTHTRTHHHKCTCTPHIKKHAPTHLQTNARIRTGVHTCMHACTQRHSLPHTLWPAATPRFQRARGTLGKRIPPSEQATWSTEQIQANGVTMSTNQSGLPPPATLTRKHRPSRTKESSGRGRTVLSVMMTSR